jgi:hypothetical protein
LCFLRFLTVAGRLQDLLAKPGGRTTNARPFGIFILTRRYARAEELSREKEIAIVQRAKDPPSSSLIEELYS